MTKTTPDVTPTPKKHAFEQLEPKLDKLLNHCSTRTINGWSHLTVHDRPDLRQVALIRVYEKLPSFTGVRKPENIDVVEGWAKNGSGWKRTYTPLETVKVTTFVYGVMTFAMLEYARETSRQSPPSTGSIDDHASTSSPSFTTTDGSFSQIIEVMREVGDCHLLLYPAMGYSDQEIATGVNLRMRRSRASRRLRLALTTRGLLDAEPETKSQTTRR